MTFKEIYEQTILLWPETLDFSDGVIIEPPKSKKKTTLQRPVSENIYSENLSKIFQQVKEKVDPENNYITAMIWTQYEYIVKQALFLFSTGKTTLNVTDLDKIALEERYFNELVNGMYDQELADYKRDL